MRSNRAGGKKGCWESQQPFLIFIELIRESIVLTTERVIQSGKCEEPCSASFVVGFPQYRGSAHIQSVPLPLPVSSVVLPRPSTQLPVVVCLLHPVLLPVPSDQGTTSTEDHPLAIMQVIIVAFITFRTDVAAFEFAFLNKLANHHAMGGIRLLVLS